jgi:hypothetical protein
MKHQILVGLGLFTLTVAVLPASAQEGDARAGLTVAQGTCTACHAIRKGQQSANANTTASRGSPVFGHDGDSAAGVLADVTSLHAKPHSIDGGSAERGCLYLEFANQVSCRRGKARYLIHAAPSASPVAGSRYKRRGQAEVQRSEAQPLRVCPSSNASGQSEQCWNGGSGSFWVGV